MKWWAREQHVCARVTAGEVDAVLTAVQSEYRLNECLERRPMIDSLVNDLSDIRLRNHFAESFRKAFQGGGG